CGLGVTNGFFGQTFVVTEEATGAPEAGCAKAPGKPQASVEWAPCRRRSWWFVRAGRRRAAPIVRAPATRRLRTCTQMHLTSKGAVRERIRACTSRTHGPDNDESRGARRECRHRAPST